MMGARLKYWLLLGFSLALLAGSAFGSEAPSRPATEQHIEVLSIYMLTLEQRIAELEAERRDRRAGIPEPVPQVHHVYEQGRRNGELIMRCSTEGGSPDFATGGCR